MRPRDFAGLASLGALWGGSFLFIRVAVPAVGPFLLVELRVGLAATALLVPLSAVGVPGEAPTLPVVLSMLALALLSTAVAYLIYFRLIENVGPTSTLTVTLLVPVFGLLFGVVFLNEPFGVGTLAGLAIILYSVVLITGIRPPAISKNKKPDR